VINFTQSSSDIIKDKASPNQITEKWNISHRTF